MSVMPFEFVETVILQLTNLRVGVGDGGGRDCAVRYLSPIFCST